MFLFPLIKQPRSIIHFLHAFLLCCFLRLTSNAVHSCSLVSPATPLHLAVLCMIQACWGQLLPPCLSRLYPCFQFASLLKKFPGTFAHLLLSFLLDLPKYFLTCGNGVHLLNSSPVFFMLLSSSTFYRTSYLLANAITKSSFTFFSLNLDVQHLFLVDFGFFPASSFILISATTRWWSEPASALRFILVSWNALLHLLLMATWSIWFSIAPSGGLHVSLWDFLYWKISLKFNITAALLYNLKTWRRTEAYRWQRTAKISAFQTKCLRRVWKIYCVGVHLIDFLEYFLQLGNF